MKILFVTRESELDRRYGLGKSLAPLVGELQRRGHAVGYVTSADFGYTVGHPILLAWLPPELAHEGAQVDVDIFGEHVGATVTHEPLYDPQGERLRV